MPHIKSIRLVNVHFNNATQFYDDFKMEFGGKNATYDLENGGGKSLLLLMILQTVLPKSFLRREKPVSLLFQGGRERTSHVAVEWILEEGSQYKYLITGFSARKRKGSKDLGSESNEDDENIQAGDIEHINWCIFHNGDKSTGIKFVPLRNDDGQKKTYAGFDEVRKYVQLMRQKGLPAEIFDGIDKYLSFISAHHLIAAEWNIIKGINSGENSIESYFRQNPTSRKLIENQFVKIVEDIEALNRGERSNKESLLLADTLIEIRNRLNEYLRLKGHMSEYEKIKGYYSEFKDRNEKLLEGFRKFEAYKSQAVGVRNLIESRLNQLEAEKLKATKKKEYDISSCKEGELLCRLLEAGFVQHDIREFTNKKEKMEYKVDCLAKEQQEIERNYNELMTLEAYGDYRKMRERLCEDENSLSVLENDKDEITNQYREAGGKFKYLLDKSIGNGSVEEEKLKQTLKKLEQEKNVIRQELIKEERREAQKESQRNALEEQDKKLSGEVSKLQESFVKSGEMDVVMDPKGVYATVVEQKSDLESQHNKVSERIDEIDIETRNLDLKLANIKGEIRVLEEKKNSDVRWLDEYQRQLSEFENKASGFNCNSIKEYLEELELSIHTESLRKLEMEIEVGRLKQKKQLSSKRGCYVPNEEILTFAEQLSGKCEYVKAGIDWIAEMDTDMRRSILEELPYLPFCVIVDGKSFEKLKSGKIITDFSSDYPIPVVNVDIVRGVRDPAKSDLYYFCSFSDLLLDSARFDKYMLHIDAEIESMNREIEVSNKRLEEFNLDFRKLKSFVENYSIEKVEQVRERVYTINKEVDEYKKQMLKKEKEKEHINDEKNRACTRLKELLESIKDLEEKIDKLQKLIKSQEELTIVRNDLSCCKKEHQAIKEAIDKIKEQEDSIENKIISTREEENGIGIRLHDLKKERKELESFADVENSESMESVRAEYKAKKDAISGKIANESDLRRNIEDLKSRIKDLKSKIARDYQGDLESISKREIAGEIIIVPTEDSILKGKRDKDGIVIKIKDAQENLAKISKDLSKSEGKLSEILKSVPKEQEVEIPSFENKDRYEEEIKYTKQLVLSYEEEIKKTEKDIEQIKVETGKLKIQIEHYDSFIKRENVLNDKTVADALLDFRRFEDEYESLKKIISNQCEKWSDRIRIIEQETIEYVIREPLEELAKISQPKTALKCEQRREAFREYIMNIEEQMQKITNDILQLESYQQDFTRRCIQRAELVLGHLRKVESLSKIEVYGRRTNMVELKLQEFEDKEKQFRMKNHIDTIVKEISEEGKVDRKRVAAKLSTKELLAQIVDMDKAAVRLYKIESIPENSKFYRWEYAIGSEGQNNSLYFIFAACLISFIRMLSITNTSLKTKKVIIVDNPFGATSAVYLWDPMFKIMKQNDIQLIAPGHRIPREITSRFGVSYLLNQDILQDGRMRVVVKDVRVEEDEDVMRYIEPEQLTLF